MKKLIIAYLILASFNVYSKQAEKLSLKRAENFNLKQIRNLIPAQPIVYVCKIEASTGYAYKDGKWQVTQFETGEKFLLKEFIKDDPGFNTKDKTPFGVFDIGEKNPQMFCTVNEEAGSISCAGIGTLEFSSETRLFLRVDAFGSISYPSDDVTYSNGPKMMHGSCVLKREVNL